MARSERMTSVAPTRLKYAREYYGLSIEEASKRASIKPDALAAFEAGNEFSTYPMLERLSELYNRPLLFFFFQSEPPQDQLLVEFRSSESQSGRPLEMQVRMMMEKADWYRLQLETLHTDTNTVRFFALLQQNQVETDQHLIQWLREQLDLPLKKQKTKFRKANELLEYLRDKLYQIGIYVFKDSFKADEVSGLCLYDEDYPVILLNNKMSFTRQIFTVFHEIYHLFTKETDVYYTKYEEEKACDQFASEFLVPKVDFQAQLANVTEFESIELISALADEYTVSWATIAYRLMKLGKISKSFYTRIHMDGVRKANSASAAGNFYYTRISYLGVPYLKSVFSGYYTGKISIADVGRYTGLKVSHISRMLSSNMLGGVLS